MKKNISLIVVLVFFLAACNLPGPDENSGSDQEVLETIVAATMGALTQENIINTSEPLSTAMITEAVLPTITPTATLNGTVTPEPGFGSISGSISGYPYGDLPQLSIVAFEQQASNYWFWITGAGDTYFSMDGYVSSGKYQVVAYDSSGHTGGCATIVEVKNNEMVICNITHWGGGYPAKPAGVP